MGSRFALYKCLLTHNKSIFLVCIQIIGSVDRLRWFHHITTIHFRNCIIAVIVIEVNAAIVITVTIEIRRLLFQQGAAITRQ